MRRWTITLLALAALLPTEKELLFTYISALA